MRPLRGSMNWLWTKSSFEGQQLLECFSFYGAAQVQAFYFLGVPRLEIDSFLHFNSIVKSMFRFC